jgi:uncharacterized membrane protein YGL010W
MRSREQYLTEYARSHKNPLNKVIHMICVPAIFFATGGIGWSIPIGSLFSWIPESIAPWINLATLIAIPIIVFYARLGPQTLITGLSWLAITVALCIAIQATGPFLLWISITVWVLAWAAQFYGHYVEGAKPSFGDDLIFLLIGPLFVQEKFGRLVRTGSI